MAKKTSGFARTTISLPADLKRRMDTANEAVNWSSVAAGAFEKMLGELAAKKERKTMDDVVQRLRASKRQSQDERFKQGFVLGQEWAKDTADAEELERLKSLKDTMRADEWEASFETTSNCSETVAESFFFLLNPSTDSDRHAAESFWEIAVGDDHGDRTISPSFVRGFAEGALEVWYEVEAKL